MKYFNFDSYALEKTKKMIKEGKIPRIFIIVQKGKKKAKVELSYGFFSMIYKEIIDEMLEKLEK